MELSCKESSTSKPSLPFSEGKDVAGDAIALPEFWSASGACALKGWLECLRNRVAIVLRNKIASVCRLEEDFISYDAR